ncbi:MAG: hypothetical protein LV471_02245 [Nitrosomonas sp.]|nr:hypothetical protein [Nitrosomonas sp.]
MVKAYENRIKKLETDKAALIEKSSQSPRPVRSCGTALRIVKNLLRLNGLLIRIEESTGGEGGIRTRGTV